MTVMFSFDYGDTNDAFRTDLYHVLGGGVIVASFTRSSFRFFDWLRLKYKSRK